MDSYYDIYSTGKLIDGADLAHTRAALARLFKTTEDKVAHLIAGKPQLIKRRVEKTEALRYKAALQQAGLQIGTKVHEEAQETVHKEPTQATTIPATPPTPPTSPTEPSTQYAYTLAPTGSDLLLTEEKTPFSPRDIDTTHLTLTSPTVYTEPATQPPVITPDISHITLAAPGTPLEPLKNDTPSITPDISHLAVAEAGADLIPSEYRKQESTTPPTTDHIQLAHD